MLVNNEKNKLINDDLIKDFKAKQAAKKDNPIKETNQSSVTVSAPDAHTNAAAVGNHGNHGNQR